MRRTKIIHFRHFVSNLDQNTCQTFDGSWLTSEYTLTFCTASGSGVVKDSSNKSHIHILYHYHHEPCSQTNPFDNVWKGSISYESTTL